MILPLPNEDEEFEITLDDFAFGMPLHEIERWKDGEIAEELGNPRPLFSRPIGFDVHVKGKV